MAKPNPAHPSLADACAECFVLAMGLRASAEPADAAALKTTVSGALERMTRRAKDAGIDSKRIDAARYALCALIDETVLSSSWAAARSTWVQRPLQMEYFGTFNAGDEFFDRLEALRGSDEPGDVDALEVHAQCLALGFRGRYADLAGMQTIATKLDDICKEILRARGESERALSDPWERRESLPDQVRRIPVWVAPAVAVGGALLLLWFLDALLVGQAAEALRQQGVGR